MSLGVIEEVFRGGGIKFQIRDQANDIWAQFSSIKKAKAAFKSSELIRSLIRRGKNLIIVPVPD